jgi:hypothetical protein
VCIHSSKKDTVCIQILCAHILVMKMLYVKRILCVMIIKNTDTVYNTDTVCKIHKIL